MPSNRAKVFAHRGGQAVLLPDGFGFDAPEVDVERQGEAVILKPRRPKAPRRTAKEWAEFWARIDADADMPFSDRE